MDSKILYHNSFAGQRPTGLPAHRPTGPPAHRPTGPPAHRPTGNLPVAHRASPSLTIVKTYEQLIAHLGMTLNSSGIPDVMGVCVKLIRCCRARPLNCGHGCDFGNVDEAVPGGKHPAKSH